MGANYSHTSRSDGELVTSTVYNQDHQNHIDNLVPLQIDDYSSNVTQMQATTDPGESGSESLATSLAGELERLRFIIKEMKNATQWYTTAASRVISLQPCLSNGSDTYTDGSVVVARAFWRVPTTYVSGDLTWSFYRRTTSYDGGTHRMTYSIDRRREGTTSVSIAASVDTNFIPGNTNTVKTDVTIGAANFQAGDFIALTLSRLGNDAGDTTAANTVLDGATITFTGIAGRV